MARFIGRRTRPDRAALRERLRSALLRHPDRRCTLAVVVVEFERSKLDSRLGRGERDELLDAIVDRLRGVLRWNEQPARCGGDRFVVLCDGLADGSESGLIARRIVAAFERPLHLPVGPLLVTPRVGVAVTSTSAIDPDDLLAQATAALRRATRTGTAGFALAGTVERAGVGSVRRSS